MLHAYVRTYVCTYVRTYVIDQNISHLINGWPSALLQLTEEKNSATNHTASLLTIHRSFRLLGASEVHLNGHCIAFLIVPTYPTKFSDILEIRGVCQVPLLFCFASSHVAAVMWDPALPVYSI